jgi:mannosyltransferase OCH1-like enzyme
MNDFIIGIGIFILFLLSLLYIYFQKEYKIPFSNKFSYDENDLLIIPDASIKTINVIKKNSNTEIPLNIFMTYKTKNLTSEMQKSIDIVKEAAPEFNIYIYDNEDCRNFLKKYFIKDVLESFDNLIPGAYKADLWRYCILYYYGGIYQDIKYKPYKDFKYIELTDKEYFVKDRWVGNSGIYNALLVCKPRNIILYKCIKQIIQNVKSKYYGKSSLEPTGPLLMKQFFTTDQFNSLSLYFKRGFINDYEHIIKDNEIILESFNKYRKQQDLFKHYSYLYLIKSIYK